MVGGFKMKKNKLSYVVWEFNNLLWVVKFLGRWSRANFIAKGKCTPYYNFEDLTEAEAEDLIKDYPRRNWTSETEGLQMFCVSGDDEVIANEERKKNKAERVRKMEENVTDDFHFSYRI